MPHLCAYAATGDDLVSSLRTEQPATLKLVSSCGDKCGYIIGKMVKGAVL